MRTVLLGPYPPPLGGISVYIYRHAKQLRKLGMNVSIVDYSKKSFGGKLLHLLQFLLDPRPATYHLNMPNYSVMLALILRPFPAHLIYQDHSGRSIPSFKWHKRIILGAFLKRVDECIMVGEHLKGYYHSAGISLPKNVQIQNAFLPPPLEDEVHIWKSYDPDTHCFIEKHKPLIVANAYQIAFHEGVDLYGLDLCVELVAGLEEYYPNLGLIFALAEVGDDSYYHKIWETIKSYDIQDHIHFMTGQKELWPLFKKADVMVRPTAVDAYGVSIAEALHFGCPAVASDVCERASGTVIFRNRDAKDFIEKVRQVLDATSR